MTSGAARLFQHQTRKLPQSHPFQEIYRRITARENNWISAQWMTERPGGSDVQNTETVALHAPQSEAEKADKTDAVRQVEQGEWLVSGFKWFSSATDCDIALMLAKTEPSQKLSLFVAPTQIKTTDPETGVTKQVSNGIRIHRLKNKFGTKPLPTAELELRNVRAHLVGEIDRGVPTIATLLNVTRTHNFITALSCWRRSMMITKAFARARTSIDQPLWLFPMHLRLLANMEVRFQGCFQLAFFTTAQLSFIDNGVPHLGRSNTYAPLPNEGEEMKVVLRTLTATSKAVICKTATSAMWECAEAMGGVGYMDEPDEPEFNILRLMRDTSANVIWEGTTNVLASEVVRHLRKANHLALWESWLQRSIKLIQDTELKECLEHSWSGLKKRSNEEGSDLREVLADGREIMFSLAWIVSSMLLCIDAQRDGDEAALEVARRWILDQEAGVGEFLLPGLRPALGREKPWQAQQRGEWDCRIVWGIDLPKETVTGYRAV
jgi:alkylation response protein AidB-like acyl-CoA dehydrogenase